MRTSIALLLVFLAGSLFAHGPSVQVDRVDNLSSAFERLVVLSPSCPPHVDCIWFERNLTEHLMKRKIKVVPSSLVRHVLFEMEATEVTDELRREVAKRVQADAFLLASVDHADREKTGSVGSGTALGIANFVTGLFGATPIERSTGNIQIVIIRAEDGKVLMRGSGFAESEVRSLRGVLSRISSEIFERAFYVPLNR